MFWATCSLPTYLFHSDVSAGLSMVLPTYGTEGLFGNKLVVCGRNIYKWTPWFLLGSPSLKQRNIFWQDMTFNPA